MERGRNIRVPTQFEADYSGGQLAGHGVLTDLSKSGARVDEVSITPSVGTKVRIHVSVQPFEPLELTGCVARLTPNGFAVEFSDVSTEAREFLADLIAITSPAEVIGS